jgi:ABC-type uncharacterized transport system permease subunit
MLVLFLSTIAAYAVATFFRVKEKVSACSFRHHADFSLLLGLTCNAVMIGKVFTVSDTHLHFQSLFLAGAMSLGISTLAIEKCLRETFFSIFTIPAMIVFLICATFVDGTLAGTYFRQGWFATHLLLSILGESFFCIAAISSVTYYYVVRRLKKKNRLRAVFFFPPLTRLDDLTFKLMAAGTILFSLGLAVGFYGSMAHFSASGIGSKHVLALLVMLYYAAVLATRRSFSITGTRLANAALIGFFLSLILITVPDNTSHWQPMLRQQEGAR